MVAEGTGVAIGEKIEVVLGPGPRERPLGLGTRRRRNVARLSLLLIVLATWQLGAPLLGIPSFLLPAPDAIVRALVQGLLISPLDETGFAYHLAVTLAEAFAGFVIGGLAGLILGALLAHVAFLERAMLPYIMGFQSLPKVALAPLIMIWFGIGMSSKVVLVTLLTFFPLLINSLLGFKSVDPERIELLRSLDANRWQIFRLVRVPSSMPAIFAGIEIAILFSLTGTIVGELLAGQAGLGVLIQRTQRSFYLAGTFAVLVLLAMVGVALVTLAKAIRRRVLFWAAEQVNVNV